MLTIEIGSIGSCFPGKQSNMSILSELQSEKKLSLPPVKKEKDLEYDQWTHSVPPQESTTQVN